MLVDALLIPHPAGSVQVRFDERATVLAGLDAPARARLAHLLTSALAGAGPATVLVRDDLGQAGRIGPGDGTGPDADAVARVHRRIVVGPADLGLGADPDPTEAAARAAVEAAHRQLVDELAVIEAGAARRARHQAELADLADPTDLDAPTDSAVPADEDASTDPAEPADLAEPGDEGDGPDEADGAVGGVAPDGDVLATSAARVDELLLRRREAGDVLEQTAAMLRSVEEDPALPPLPSAGDLRPSTSGPLANGLQAARDVLRRVSGATVAPGADRRRAELDAHIALARARAEIDLTRARAQGDIHACDVELAALARSAGLAVGVEGPGAALGQARAERRHAPAAQRRAAPADPAARVLAHQRAHQRAERRATLHQQLADLPDDAEVEAARRRLDAVADHLPGLSGPRADLERVRTALLGRVALLRPDGVAAVAPLVLDEPFAGLPPDDLLDLLDLAVRLGERAQVVLLTGDPAVATWARHRAAGGHVRLVEPATPLSPGA